MPMEIPETLQEVELDFLCHSTMIEAQSINHWQAMPDLVSPHVHDPFSSSLRVLSYALLSMTLRAQVDKILFWLSDGTTPHWPHLRILSIMFYQVSPSGAWYFEGPRGEGRNSTGYQVNALSYPPLETTEDDECSECQDVEDDRSFENHGGFFFRIVPNDNVMGPFLTGLAKAALHMPKLEFAVLWSPMKWDVERDSEKGQEFDYYDPPTRFDCNHATWGLAYGAVGTRFALSTNPGERYCDTRQIWWQVGDWRPSAELHDLFRQIGGHKDSEATREHWMSDQVGDGLLLADAFSTYTPESR
jgi:hypothetical protein